MKQAQGKRRFIAIYRRQILRLTSFLILATAAVWLTACSGTGARSAAGVPSSSAPSTNYTQPRDASTPTGEGLRGGPSPAAANGSAVSPKNLTVNDAGPGGVTVKATWVIPGSPEASSAQLDRNLAFKVTLDTHSVDLTKYNVAKLSALRDDQGKEIPGADWKSTSGDSHHREGILIFPQAGEDGRKYVELVMRELGGVKERVLRWELAS